MNKAFFKKYDDGILRRGSLGNEEKIRDRTHQLKNAFNVASKFLMPRILKKGQKQKNEAHVQHVFGARLDPSHLRELWRELELRPRLKSQEAFLLRIISHSETQDFLLFFSDFFIIIVVLPITARTVRGIHITISTSALYHDAGFSTGNGQSLSWY